MNAGTLAVRIVADDLTGALDAAAPLAARLGAFTVGWHADAVPDAERAAFDTGTRDLGSEAAVRRTAAVARRWWRGFSGLAFKKVDSVWRGHAAAEIAAAMAVAEFDIAVVAPAFPALGRITRDGAQWVTTDAQARCVASDLVAVLRAAGLDAARDGAGGAAARVVVCDAGDQRALEAIVERHAVAGRRRLWCGSAGLAHALARALPGADGALPSAPPAAIGSRGPIVVVVGTDHPVAQAQAAALARVPGVFEMWIDVDQEDGAGAPVAPVGASVILLRFAVRAGQRRADVQRHARQALLRAAPRLPRPRLAIATGGETLSALAAALGASELAVAGERRTGVPSCAWMDGRWAGTALFSKSGGFGAPDLLASLVLDAGAPVAAPHALLRNN